MPTRLPMLRRRNLCRCPAPKRVPVFACGIVLGSSLLAQTSNVSALPLTPHESKLTADDGEAGDVFGLSVDIDGDTAVVGANGDNGGTGAAYVFERDMDAMWTQMAKLVASDGMLSDRNGNSVAIDGDRVVTGAFLGNSAYIFERDPDGEWAQVAKLIDSDGQAGDEFGVGVAIDGNTVVVGAWADDNPGFDSGSASVFQRDPDGVWVQVEKLTPSDGGTSFERFGEFVAIQGATVLVGAQGHDAMGTNSGAAYVFERDELGNWVEVDKLTASDGQAFDSFGRSPAISGDSAVIAAVWDDDRGTDSGSAYIFERDELGNWAEVDKLTASDGQPFDTFGVQAAISGNRVVIGADGDDQGRDLGSAYIFERDEIGDWSELTKLTAADGLAGDSFGASVGISGDRALVGAPENSDTGSAYVYSLEGCELTLALDPRTVRPGEELRVAVELDHRRPITVTVPFLLWIEDAAGRVVGEKSSPPVTMEPGDHRQLRMAVRLPQGMQPGTYRVLVGVRRMQQGIAWASRQFEIVE